jgi:transposase
LSVPLAAPANDLRGEAGNTDAPAQSTGAEPHDCQPKRKSGKGKRHNHGRRDLKLSNLPIEEITLDPPEVIVNRKLFVRIGEETSSRLGFRPASYVRLYLIRTKWKRIAAVAEVDAKGLPVAGTAEAVTGPIYIAPLPPGLLPNVMADPSAIANVAVSKYDDILPLYRQERISRRNGFALPRSTQAGWLTVAFSLLYRIVEAMFAESKAHAFCIATDATGAPVQKVKGCYRWHVFTFIADNGHIVFRWADEHSGEAISQMLSGFHGYLLSDASAIYNVLQRKFGIVSVFCWAHLRREFWRATATDNALAMEALAIIAKLFDVERECLPLAMPERTEVRAGRAQPLLKLLDAWVALHNGREDIGAPLQKAIGYYVNQRDGLLHFLKDGRLPIHNNGSEGQLRNLALGRDNWHYFLNRTGLNWYTTFRSLIASCHLHSLNPQIYLEEVLRLVPHWPVTQVLQLSPKYWQQTRAALSPEHAAIIRSPWDKSVACADEAELQEPPSHQHAA